jgi:hypothetical protein
MPRTKEAIYEARRCSGEKNRESAPMVACACGCGTMIKSKDKHYRNMRYAYGHRPRKYQDPG